jgi:hypothetical protein
MAYLKIENNFKISLLETRNTGRIYLFEGFLFNYESQCQNNSQALDFSCQF